MCKCYLSQIWFCIMAFCKELGLCCMTNLNSNSGSAFSLLCDLEPNMTSLWASVFSHFLSLFTSICLSVFISLYLCLHICMNIYPYIWKQNKGCYFPFIPLKWELYMNYIHIWQLIILLTVSATILNLHSAHCYSKHGLKIRLSYLWNVCWSKMR